MRYQSLERGTSLRRIDRAWLLLPLGLTVILTGCRGSAPSSGPSPTPSAGPPGPIEASAPVPADRYGAPILPDPRLTPGAALAVGTGDICVSGYTKLVRNV